MLSCNNGIFVGERSPWQIVSNHREMLNDVSQIAISQGKWIKCIFLGPMSYYWSRISDSLKRTLGSLRYPGEPMAWTEEGSGRCKGKEWQPCTVASSTLGSVNSPPPVSRVGINIHNNQSYSALIKTKSAKRGVNGLLHLNGNWG